MYIYGYTLFYVFGTAIFIDLYDIMDLPNVAIVIHGMNKEMKYMEVM
jgi:hypothetical protein